MISAIQRGVQGMENASRLVDRAAEDISRAGAPPKAVSGTSGATGDMARDMVSMIIGHRTYDANARVVETAVRLLDEVV